MNNNPNERNKCGMEQLLENYAVMGISQGPTEREINKMVCDQARSAVNSVRERVSMIDDGRRRNSLMVKLGAIDTSLDELEEQLERAGSAKEEGGPTGGTDSPASKAMTSALEGLRDAY